MKQQTIKEAKETLKEIYEEGFRIRDIWKEKYNGTPSGKSINEIMINPDLFQYSLFENFWKLFKIISDNIETPLVLPWIRLIIEQESDIFDYYSKKNDEKKKELACKYWLCVLGFLGGKEGNLDYSDFLELIQNRTDKQKFLELKEKGYPSKNFHIRWNDLFEPVSEDKIPDSIERYLLNMNGNPIKKIQVDRFYKDMSLYHHPNLTITPKVEKEFEDKSHLFRCFALISFFGISLIKFSTEEILKNPDEEFMKGINKKVNPIILKLKETLEK
jgi:hypothetical protein